MTADPTTLDCFKAYDVRGRLGETLEARVRVRNRCGETLTFEAARLRRPGAFAVTRDVPALADGEDGELVVEVTPDAIRLRKRYLDPHERKRMAKSA